MRSPRDLIVPVAVLVGVVALVAAVAARDDSPSRDASSSAATTSTSGSDESAADNSSDIGGGTSVRRSTTTGAVPTVAPSSVAPPAATVPVPVPTTGATAAPSTPPISDPFASTPPTELAPEPDELPGPPSDDCIDTAAAQPTVELSFDLDHVRYGAVMDPSCVRIHGSQRLSVRSESAVATSVSVGADVWELSNGASSTTEPLGTLFQVGDVFDVYVESLDITVLVQVLP